MRVSSTAFGLLAVLVLASEVRAQGLADPRGVLVGNAQSAAVDDATALTVNPAGLAHIDGMEIQSGWITRAGSNFALEHNGDMAAVVSGPLGLIAGGLGIELPPGSTPRLRASVGTATALDRTFLMGATLHGVQRIGVGTSDVFVDVGTQMYPARFLGFGLVAENLGSKEGGSLRGGMSVRPVDELLTVGVDARFIPSTGDLGSIVGNGTVIPALSARLQLGGVVVGAGAQVLNLGAQAAAPIAVEATASLQLDLGNVGMTLIGGVDGLGGNNAQRGVFGARSRASTTTWPSLLPISGRWLGLTLTDDGVPLRKSNSLIDELFTDTPSPAWVLAALDNTADDPSVEGVILRFEGLRLGWGRATELRAAITRLRAAGKTVVVHLIGGDDVDVFMASAANQIWLTPSSSLALDGLRAQMVYIGSSLNKLGVSAEAVAAGRYKSAPRMFTHDAPSPEELEVENALLDGAFNTLVNSIAEGRSLGPQEVKDIIDLGGLTAREALEKKIVDALAYDDEIPGLIAKLAGRGGDTMFVEGTWLSTVTKDRRWDAPVRVALIPIVGTIQMGSSRGGLLSSGGAGADDVVEAVNRAAEDSSVKAIVLRIDSPGGDALASDLMWRAVMLAREKKPVIATMGDVAASGGYYVASAAHEIFAEDDTVTGSIGVFGLLFSAGRLADDLGIKSYEQSRGSRPGPDLFRGPTDAERARMQESVDKTYEQFLDAIIAGRGDARLSKDELRLIAEGRVWTGAEAHQRKLVDHKGSVVDALKMAREKAGLPADEPIELAVMTGQEGELPSLGALGGMMSQVLGVSKHDGLSAAVRLLLGDPEMAAFVVDNEGKPLLLGPSIQLR
ncbi:MAG: signal peptide peptidase SppA [Deltaproteobacteria bacterium]|nr:signal peptide peptidase SppA [Deltaproteobacteria bacterium]